MECMQNDCEDAQAVLDARRLVYALAARLFSTPPTEELHATVKNGDLSRVCAALPFAQASLGPVLADFEIAAREIDCEGCRREHALLFEGLRETVYPWESVHVCGEPLLFQPCTLAVREAYRAEGFQAAGYPNEPDDHMASECAFLATLAERAAAAHARADESACVSALEASERFLDEHLGAWVDDFADAFLEQDAASRQGFYACCARFVAAFARLDRRTLGSLRDRAGSEA